MNLNSKNLRLVLLGLLGLSVVLFIGIMIAGSSALASKSRQMVNLKIQSQTADLQLSNLEQSKKDVEKYSYFKDVAKTVIPSDKNQAQSVLDIFQIADAAGISIQSITFPSSTLGTSSLSVGTTPGQDATTPGATQKAISQAVPVTGIPGLYSLQLLIVPDYGVGVAADKQITYPKMLDFLSRIENNRRTAQVTQIDINPSGANQALTFNLTINTFIKP